LKEKSGLKISNSSYKAMRIFLEMIESGEECPLTGSGNSMRPFLRGEEDILIMMPVNSSTIRAGDIFLYQRDDGIYVIHRLYKICSDGTCWFIGDNQLYLEKNIALNQLRAKAKCVVKNGKAISCEHGFIRCYYTLRMRCRVLGSRIVRKFIFS